MNRKHFVVATIGVLASALAMAQQDSAVPESDFARPAARIQSSVRAAAEKALRDFSSGMQAEKGTLPHGFPFAVNDVGDLAQAYIAYGFQVNDADPQALLSGLSLQESSHPNGQWRFSVMLGQRPIGLITMAQTGAGWTAVSMGGAGLSKEIDAVVRVHGGATYKHLRYVRVPQATADFIEVKSDVADTGFVPLQAARESLLLRGGNPGSEGMVGDGELQPRLKSAVSRNLDK